jgi:pimeloyl-ACP methyl ester carboxylesterase
MSKLVFVLALVLSGSLLSCVNSILTTSIKSRFFDVELPPQAKDISEFQAQALMKRIGKTLVIVPEYISSSPVFTTFAFLERQKVNEKESFLFDINRNQRKAVPIVLLHGFDSSCLEFRRLAPLLNDQRDVYAVDILGWGFNEMRDVKDVSPTAKMEHLRCFIKQIVGGKCIVIGASLGGALAITLAAESPELVEKVVLIDAQGFIDGKGPSDIPDGLARFGVNILKSWPLRMYANTIAYSDGKYATWDAMLVGRLHCLVNSWEVSSVKFLKSGGFVMSSLVSKVKQPALVIWGAQVIS